MRNHKAGVVLLAMAGVVPVAHAELVGNENLSANFAMTTNYYFRGFTQNADKAALQAGIDYGHDSGLYAGAWGSTVDNDTFSGAGAELNVYGGWAGELEAISLDVGYLRYIYPGDNVSNFNDTSEWHIGVSRDFGMVAAGATFNRSPDFFGFGEADYWDFSLDMPINDDWSVHAHYGSTRFDEDKNQTKAGVADSYHDSNVGVATSLGPIGIDFTATSTGGVVGGCGGGTACESQFILTFSVEL